MKETYASMKKSKWFPLGAGIVSLILGVICILNPQIRMEGIAMFAGILFLLYGILQIISGVRIENNTVLRWMYILLGVVIVVLSVFIFANLELIGKYLPTLGGFFMIVCAVTNLLPALSLLKNGMKNWWFGALPAVVLLVLGLVFLLQPGFVGQTFGIFAGISLLVNGVSSLISFFQIK